MRISFVYLLSVLAGRGVMGADDTYRHLRRVKDLDKEDEKILIEEIFDGDAEGVGQRNLACDEICRAKRRLVRCKRKAREEAREGRNAWTKEDQDETRGGRRLKLYCKSPMSMLRAWAEVLEHVHVQCTLFARFFTAPSPLLVCIHISTFLL